jgi:O-antigen/teichoic acid export membrane protein
MLAPSALLNAIGLQAPLLLVAYLYGPTVAGWLGMTQRVLALPATLLGAAIAQVFLAEFASRVRENAALARRLFHQTSRRLTIVAAVTSIVLALFGPWMVALIFGKEWAESGHYARALAVSLAVQLVAFPVGQTLIVLERLALQLCSDITRLVATVGAIFAAWMVGSSALTAIWWLSIASAASYAAAWLTTRWVVTHTLPMDRIAHE